MEFSWNQFFLLFLFEIPRDDPPRNAASNPLNPVRMERRLAPHPLNWFQLSSLINYYYTYYKCLLHLRRRRRLLQGPIDWICLVCADAVRKMQRDVIHPSIRFTFSSSILRIFVVLFCFVVFFFFSNFSSPCAVILDFAMMNSIFPLGDDLACRRNLPLSWVDGRVGAISLPHPIFRFFPPLDTWQRCLFINVIIGWNWHRRAKSCSLLRTLHHKVLLVM